MARAAHKHRQMRRRAHLAHTTRTVQHYSSPIFFWFTPVFSAVPLHVPTCPPWPCTNLAGHHHHHPRQRYALAARRQSVAYAGGRASERSISGIFPRPHHPQSSTDHTTVRPKPAAAAVTADSQEESVLAGVRPSRSLHGAVRLLRGRGASELSKSVETDVRVPQSWIWMVQLHPVKARPCSLHLSTVHVIQDPTTHVPCPFNCC